MAALGSLFAARGAPRYINQIIWGIGMVQFSLTSAVVAGIFSLVAAGFASPAFAGENGYGPDPDKDGNPATDARGFYRLVPVGEAELDPPFRLVTFEPPPGQHGATVRGQYEEGYGVTFSKGLTLQACEGQRYFRYDTKCTYLAPPSGKFAAVYHDDFRRPLRIRFERPVCAASMAISPTGGREGERFVVALDFYKKEGDLEKRIANTRVDFTWSQNMFKWRNMVEALMIDKAADRIDVTIRSRSRRSENFDFLIDDLAFIEDIGSVPGSACQARLNEIRLAADDVQAFAP